MLRVFSFATLLFLAGCAAKPLDVSQVTSIQPTNGGNNVDVYQERRAKGESVPEFAGDQIVDVRTYATNENGTKGAEFAGAQCHVEARDFKADVTTPAKVRLPVYRAASSPLTVECQHQDYQLKLVDHGVYNQTQSDRLQAGSSAGLVGLLVMATVNGVSSTTGDDYQYAPVEVLMTPLGKGKAQQVANNGAAAPATLGSTE